MKKTLVLLVVLTLMFSGISTILSNISIAATPLVIEFINGTVMYKMRENLLKGKPLDYSAEEGEYYE